MSLRNTIGDLQNMRRSMELRTEQDPKKVVDILEAIMRDAVIAQASGSRTFQKKSLNEMAQIRKDLAMGQINAGNATGPMVGIYSHLLDQMNSMQEDNKKSSSSAMDAFKELGRSIPSADTFVSALMTANPLLGFGVKISRDIYRSSKEFSRRRTEEAAKRMEILKQQEAFIEQELNNAKKEEEAKAKAAKALLNPVVTPATPSPFQHSGVYQKSLDAIQLQLFEIRKEIIKLNIIWGGDSHLPAAGSYGGPSGPPSPHGLNQVDPADKEIIDILDRMLEQQKHAEQAEINALHEQALAEDRQRRLNELGAPPGDPAPPTPDDDPLNEQKKGFGKILETVLAPLMTLFRTSLMAFGLAVGEFLIDFIAIPAMIGTAIYKLLDGFFNAEKIIGKSTEDITMLDRVKAGVANIWGSILKAVDWVTGLFGVHLFDSKDMEKKIYKFFDSVQDSIVNTFHSLVDGAKSKYEEITKSISNIYDDVFGFIQDVEDFITDKFKGITDFFTSVKDRGIIDTIKGLFSGNTAVQANGWNRAPDSSGSLHRDANGNVTSTPDATPGTPVPAPDTGWHRPIDPVETPDTTAKPLRMNNTLTPETNLNNAGNQMNATMRRAEAMASTTNNSAPTVIAAPTTNNTTNNQHNYSGPTTSANLDPDFRSMIRPA